MTKETGQRRPIEPGDRESRNRVTSAEERLGANLGVPPCLRCGSRKHMAATASNKFLPLIEFEKLGATLLLRFACTKCLVVVTIAKPRATSLGDVTHLESHVAPNGSIAWASRKVSADLRRLEREREQDVT